MKLAFLGDSHGDWPGREVWPKVDLCISVGDFGFWPGYEDRWAARKPDYPVWFIDGNHEHFPSLLKARGGSITGVGLVEVWPGAFHVPRGHTERLGSLLVGFCGGGESVDRAYRTPGMDWFPEERVQLVSMLKVDVLVTHEPPLAVNRLVFNDQGDWYSKYSATVVELLVAETQPKLVVSGHLHHRLEATVSAEGRPPYTARVLDINEFYVLDTEEHHAHDTGAAGQAAEGG